MIAGNHLLQEEVALQDFCWIAGQPFETACKSGVLIIELVWVIQVKSATVLLARSVNNCCKRRICRLSVPRFSSDPWMITKVLAIQEHDVRMCVMITLHRGRCICGSAIATA